MKFRTKHMSAVGLLSILVLLITACEETSEPSVMPAHDHTQHKHHAMVELTTMGNNIAKPSVELTISKDPMSGWNLHINTANYRFTPEEVNRNNVANQGHAHLYIDGYKMARIYSHWYHIKDLTPGEHIVRITLNANDHSEFAYNGEHMAATATIIQPE